MYNSRDFDDMTKVFLILCAVIVLVVFGIGMFIGWLFL